MSYCNNLSRFTKSLYRFLTEAFSFGLGFSELGVTDHLVIDMARYASKTGDKSIEIYKTTWKTESIYGNDLDLFVENQHGTYNWYVLQAKVMSHNGAFKDLNYNHNAPIQQWDKLLKHESKYGSKSYYLLYSGRSKINPTTSKPTRGDCLGFPTLEDLALGIVETKTIKHIRNNVLRPYGMLYFKHVFPNEIDSLRMIFCCRNSLPDTREYSRGKIDTGGYKKIYYKGDFVLDQRGSHDDHDIDDSGKNELATYRIIISKPIENNSSNVVNI